MSARRSAEQTAVNYLGIDFCFLCDDAVTIEGVAMEVLAQRNWVDKAAAGWEAAELAVAVKECGTMMCFPEESSSPLSSTSCCSEGNEEIPVKPEARVSMVVGVVPIDGVEKNGVLRVERVPVPMLDDGARSVGAVCQ